MTYSSDYCPINVWVLSHLCINIHDPVDVIVNHLIDRIMHRYGSYLLMYISITMLVRTANTNKH